MKHKSPILTSLHSYILTFFLALPLGGVGGGSAAQAQMRPDQYDLQLMKQAIGIPEMPQLPLQQYDTHRPDGVVPMVKYLKQEELNAGQPVKVWTPADNYLSLCNNIKGSIQASDVSGQIIVRSEWGMWVNYRNDPSYTFDYTPLQLPATKKEWLSQRDELSRLCHEEVWGVVPEAASRLKVAWDIKPAPATDVQMPASCRCRIVDITGTVDISSYPQLPHTPQVRARVYLPMDVKGDIPAVVHLSGIHRADSIFLTQCLSHGWAYIQYDHLAVQPDNGEWLTDYLIGLCSKGQRRSPSDWGALAAWGWGVSRLVDLFSDKKQKNANPLARLAIDGRRVCVSGHSRCGKAAMVTMVNDPRIAAAFISCSGCGGAAPLRRHYGEDIEQVATYAEYHWMAGNVTKYCGPLRSDSFMPRRVSTLPVDSHVMIALCAPRPVFISGGTTDLWADPWGMFLTCQRAAPVYKALTGTGFDTTDTTPHPDKAYTDGPLAYRMHTGGHVDNIDFPYVCSWLEKYFK